MCVLEGNISKLRLSSGSSYRRVKLWVRSWSYGLYDGAVEAAAVHPLAPSLLPQHLRAHQQFVAVLIPVFCNHFLQFSPIARHDENKNGVSVVSIKIYLKSKILTLYFVQ